VDINDLYQQRKADASADDLRLSEVGRERVQMEEMVVEF
jgi:hypothetical protein